MCTIGRNNYAKLFTAGMLLKAQLYNQYVKNAPKWVWENLQRQKSGKMETQYLAVKQDPDISELKSVSY